MHDLTTEARHFERYVAIGDSSTEGLDDPDESGGYRGWADRLAKRIATIQGSVLYANLGVRGRRTRQIRDEQLDRAAALRPDLSTIFSGTNDVLARDFDPRVLADDVAHIQGTLIDGGATVLTFTLPDLRPFMPIAHLIASKVEEMNEVVREVSARTGAVLVDMAQYPVASDARLWSADRLHANSVGHERISHALAHALGLPGTDLSWSAPLPEIDRPAWVGRWAAEAVWCTRYLVPWVWRHVRGRSSGDGRTPKRPTLEMVTG